MQIPPKVSSICPHNACQRIKTVDIAVSFIVDNDHHLAGCKDGERKRQNNKQHTRDQKYENLAVPPSRCDLALLFGAMRNQRLFDIESLNELLPGRVIDAEDGLVFLNFLLSLLVDCVWLTWYYEWSVSESFGCK
jgi:hypothetical protein